jgi:Tfp pilus assembly protein PilO
MTYLSVLLQIARAWQRALIIVLSLILVLLLSRLYVNLFQAPELARQQTEWSKRREVAANVAAQQNRGTIYTSGLADLQRFRERVYPKQHFARYIGEVYDAATRNGLELTAISYKPSFIKEERLIQYSFSLAVSGTYSQVKRYLRDLEQMTNFTAIDSVSLSSQNPLEETVHLSLQITSLFRMEGP